MRPLLRSLAPLLLGAALLLGCDKSIRYGKSQVVYTSEIAPDKAKAVGDYLQAKEYFSATNHGTVKIDGHKEMVHSPPTYRVTFIVKNGSWDVPSFVDEVQVMADEMKKNIFSGTQTIVLLSNQQGREMKKLYGRP